ncbi:MAG TPA: polyprenyl synthetase family protein [Streptosporangiaceae bacterium]|nr:polyprenyl synthetase family protein [Streptosporangiaceae bacterium]
MPGYRTLGGTPLAKAILVGDAVITVVPVELADAALAADVTDGLALVEEGLRKAARAQYDLLDETSAYLMDAGGKRFRATLVLLAAQFGDPHDERVVPAAVAIELTHLATLYHDDVMDEADVRRGSPSANSRWDNSVAILTGDFLFACASKILADLGPEAVRLQAETFSRLVAGQISETVGPRHGQDPLEHYMNVVTEKTASLMATSGQFGAMFAGAPDVVTSRIAPACAALGVAFQLSDDILDVSSETDQSGKTPGTDLREGVRTMPVLHALRSAGPADARLIELLTGSDLTDAAARSETLALLRAHPAMEMAKADVRRWADLARREILALPDVPARAAFEAMCDFVIERSG